MKKLGFLFVAVLTTGLAIAAPAFASLCTDGCQRQRQRALALCSSTYAGDSWLIYQCSQEAQAEYEFCMSNCE